MAKMKTIYLQHPHQLQKEKQKSTVCALGYFDGVHLGHQKVIETAMTIAKQQQLQSAVMTFSPHPAVVLGKVDSIPAITPLKEKELAIEALGVDILYVVKFDDSFSKLTPQQFIDEYIIGLSIKHVVAGFDYTYGRFGKGTMETMAEQSRDQFDITTIKKVEKDSDKISSTSIRADIQAGQVESLPQTLGRYYRMAGTVVTGEKRGRTIGFPTANLKVSDEYVLPKEGVYAVRIRYENEWYNGMLNCGYKPTFHENREELTIEVHIFDFNQDIYGEQIIVEWRKRIRDEKKFTSVEELTKQLSADKQRVIQYFQFAI